MAFNSETPTPICLGKAERLRMTLIVTRREISILPDKASLRREQAQRAQKTLEAPGAVVRVRAEGQAPRAENTPAGRHGPKMEGEGAVTGDGTLGVPIWWGQGWMKPRAKSAGSAQVLPVGLIHTIICHEDLGGEGSSESQPRNGQQPGPNCHLPPKHTLRTRAGCPTACHGAGDQEGRTPGQGTPGKP